MTFHPARPLVATLCLTLLAACGNNGNDTPEAPTMRTLSNRADLVSDGDVLVEVTLPTGARAPASRWMSAAGT